MMSLVMLSCDTTEQLREYSENALNSIIGHDELIVIDNASSLGGGFLRSKANTYVRNNINIGYPAAVNQALKLAHGDYIAIANNDIRVSSNWRQVAEEILQDTTIGSVHFRMIGYNEPIRVGDKTWKQGRERWCSASFFVISKEAFVGYDESYKEGGYDDWDFFHRMRHLQGWKTAYTTRACYQHAHSMTYRTFDDGKNRADRDQKNREHFKQKFGEYAETIWNEKYPDQMGEDYYAFFNEV